MLLEEEKQQLAERLQIQAAMFSGNFAKPSPPQIGCVYAIEMSDGTVKIGVSTQPDERVQQVAGSVYLEIKRVHFTAFAPRSFMYEMEKRCHAAFVDRRVRGEFFDITFEEAVAELDSHADEIADALAEADQRYIDELDYFFNEFLPEYEDRHIKQTETSARVTAEKKTSVEEVAPDDISAAVIADLQQQFAALDEKVTGLENVFSQWLEEIQNQLTPADKADKLVAFAEKIRNDEVRDKMLMQAANLILGKKLF